MSDAREHALNILEQFRKTNYRLKYLTDSYYNDTHISTSDRQRTLVLTREVLRWKRRLDLWIDSALTKPINTLQPRLLTLLEIAVYELIMDDKTPDYAVIHSAVELTKKRVGRHTSGLVNAVLRKLKNVDKDTKPDNATFSEWVSMPEWLYRRWESQFGDDVTHLCLMLNTPANLTVRRNVLKIDEATFIELLLQDNILCETIPGTDRFYHVKKGGDKLRHHPLFLNSSFSFQDRGAGMVVEFFNPQPGETLLDVCAAPGTKALYCGERMNADGEILAYDSNPERVNLGKHDVQRHEMTNIQWGVKDATKDVYPMADRIMVDAPCTGTGVIGRRPDIKWRRSPEQIHEMSSLQLDILQNVSQYVKPGGILLYSTCSLEPEENWNVVEAFLKLNDGFHVKDTLELSPHTSHTDGMYAVKMERKI